MSVSTRHPDYTAERAAEWRVMRDVMGGESKIKARGEVYLPMPGGFAAQDDGGEAMYAAYVRRAQVPEWLAPTVAGMVGVIHQKEVKIDLPDSMMSIWERATIDGLSLEAFHRRITRELLTIGRYGVLVDARADGGGMPYLAGYHGETIVNWAEDRSMFVLYERKLHRTGFVWTELDNWRVLELEDGRYRQELFETDGVTGTPVEVATRGGGGLDHIPFVVIGARDLDLKPEEPPMIGVARAALAAYRLDADYRHQLYMSGQETFVLINAGGKTPSAVGAGVIIALEGAEGFTPDAKYVGPAGTGIQAHRQALVDERERAAQAGAKLFDNTARAQESGEARKLRFAAETATLRSIAQASCSGLETALRHAARMIGADPNEVVVTPPKDLMDASMSPQDALALMKLWQDGGISYQTMYENLQAGEIASQERDYEAELKLIDDQEFRPSAREAGLLLGDNPGEAGPTA